MRPARGGRGYWLGNVLFSAAVVALAVCLGIGAGSASAADSAAGGAAGQINLLPATQAGSLSLLPQAASSQSWFWNVYDNWQGPGNPAIPKGSNPWITPLTVSGYWLNTTGMWINSSAIEYQKSKNSLAVERNMLQVDFNYNFNPNNLFFVRWWGVYEPAYPFEYNSIPNFPTDFYNQYTVRDAFWNGKHGPLSMFVGRQIVTWGQSLAFRTDDVVNPQDLSWAFGFANLEQSRQPLFMIHPILQLPDFGNDALGMFTSNFLEVIFIPGLQPMYTNNDYSDDRFAGQYESLGWIDTLPPDAGRFGVRPCPFCVPTQLLAAFGAGKEFTGTVWDVPRDTWKNAEEGVRVHTIWGQTEIAAQYWHGHQYLPSLYVNQGPHTVGLKLIFPEYNAIGVSIDTPATVPVRALEALPIIARAEFLWTDRTPYPTKDPTISSGIDYSSTLNILGAIDMIGAYTPSITKTGNTSFHLEYNVIHILSPSPNMTNGAGNPWPQIQTDMQFLLNINPTYHKGLISPAMGVIYNPHGETFLLLPSLSLTPPWSPNYFITLNAIEVLGQGGNYKYVGSGALKGKSLMWLQFQYNFNLL